MLLKNSSAAQKWKPDETMLFLQKSLEQISHYKVVKSVKKIQRNTASLTADQAFFRLMKPETAINLNVADL